MSDKVYMYKGKLYCDTDLSEVDERYEDDTLGLFWELEKENKVVSETIYRIEGEYDHCYSDWSDLIEEEFTDLVVNDADTLLAELKGDKE